MMAKEYPRWWGFIRTEGVGRVGLIACHDSLAVAHSVQRSDVPAVEHRATARRSHFRLEAAMRVRELMTEGVQTVSPGESAEDAFSLMRGRRIHHLVVTRGRDVVGVLSDRDAGGRAGAAVRRTRTVSELMT